MNASSKWEINSLNLKEKNTDSMNVDNTRIDEINQVKHSRLNNWWLKLTEDTFLQIGILWKFGRTGQSKQCPNCSGPPGSIYLPNKRTTKRRKDEEERRRRRKQWGLKVLQNASSKWEISSYSYRKKHKRFNECWWYENWRKINQVKHSSLNNWWLKLTEEEGRKCGWKYYIEHK